MYCCDESFLKDFQIEKSIVIDFETESENDETKQTTEKGTDFTYLSKLWDWIDLMNEFCRKTWTNHWEEKFENDNSEG